MEEVTHLRSVIKDLQTKLDSRNQMLAYLIPHLEVDKENMSPYHRNLIEFFRLFDDAIKKFKEEYGRDQIQNGSSNHPLHKGES